MPHFHIENINRPCGSTHNRIVRYTSFANVIRYALPGMPAGAYTIHRLSDRNIYGPPVESRPAYVRAA